MIFIFLVMPLMFLSTAFFGSGYDKMSFPSNSLLNPAEGSWITNVHINGMYVHVYGDVLLFYVGIMVTLFAGYLIHQHSKWRKAVRRSLVVCSVRCAPFHPALNLNVGQLMLWMLWIPIMVTLFAFFYHIHEWEGTLRQSLESAARTFGVISSAFLGLALCPTSRGQN